MGKKIFILLVVALIGMLVLPALASATLTNEYGMHFAGQAKCLDCHSKMSGDLKVTSALHGAFATAGVNPAPPVNWTNFSAAGDIPQVGPTATGQVYSQGGIYSINSFRGSRSARPIRQSATEYLFFNGSPAIPTVMPWNLVEGLVWEPSGEWVVGDGDDGPLGRDLQLPALPHARHRP